MGRDSSAFGMNRIRDEVTQVCRVFYLGFHCAPLKNVARVAAAVFADNFNFAPPSGIAFDGRRASF